MIFLLTFNLQPTFSIFVLYNNQIHQLAFLNSLYCLIFLAMAVFVFVVVLLCFLPF